LWETADELRANLHLKAAEYSIPVLGLIFLKFADSRFTSDYLRPGVSKIIYTAVSGAQPGAIILIHDGGGDRSEPIAALPRIITRLRQRGFRLVTVSQADRRRPAISQATLAPTALRTILTRLTPLARPQRTTSLPPGRYPNE
jgi:peptidoglycan/xylan/chitin deacetylase (PgdA/CDA1 family)